MDQNDFAARLARIQEKNGQDGQKKPKAKADAPRLDAGPPRIPGDPLPGEEYGGGGGGPSFILYGMILTLLVGIGGLGTLYVLNQKKKEPGTDVAALEQSADPAAVAAAGDDPQVPADFTFSVAEQPGTTLPSAPQERGWRFGPGDVVTAQNTMLPLAELVTGYVPGQYPGAPSGVAMFDPNPECTLRRPETGEVVHNVRLEMGMGESQLHITSDAVMAKRVGNMVDRLANEQHQPPKYRAAENPLGRVDVLVTDTSGPVYLVLQNMFEDTLWNVHRAPGVEIAHIAMIGNASGLAVPQGISFEALRISDFVNPDEFDFKRSAKVPNSIGNDSLTSANGTIRPCMIVPYRAVSEDWHAFKKSTEARRYINQTAIFTEGHAAFADWYTKTLGVDPNQNLIAGEWAHHVLVGPHPAAPLGYRDTTGQTINLVRSDNVYESDADLIQAHRDLLIRAAGGDVANLDPAPMEFASQ